MLGSASADQGGFLAVHSWRIRDDGGIAGPL
jgi:hypothetical protein